MVLSRRLRIIQFLLFIAYMSLLIYLVLFSVEFGRVAVSRDYNLVPFDTIKRYINYRNRFSEISYLTNIYGNIIAFAPLGYFVYTYQNKHRLLSGLIVPMLASLAIEISQYILSVGSFDVDDIILNTLGGFIIYLIMYILFKLKILKK